MSSRDIVNQLTEEMGMNQQMLQQMQQMPQQMPMQQMPMQQMPMQQMPMQQMPMQQGSVDFSQLSPEQQILMMQQNMEKPQTEPQQAAKPDQWDDSSSESSSSSTSGGSAEMNLDKLGLNGNNGFFETFLNYIKDPLIVVIIFILFSLTQVDNIFVQFLPKFLSSGLYYLIIKGSLCGVLFFLTKLVF
jgi:hypothetical protein